MGQTNVAEIPPVELKAEPAPARVLVVNPIDPTALAVLQRRYHVTVEPYPSEPDLARLAADADALIVRSGVRVDASTIQGSRRLRVIARAGVSVDNIDLGAALLVGVQVFNVPGGSTWAVAEHAVGLMYAVARRICEADRQVRAGAWRKSALAGTQLHGKTLGLVGLGNIGGSIARLARGLGMRVLACVARPDGIRAQQVGNEGVELVDLATVLRQCDLLCPAVPLTAQTHRMLGPAELRAMKPGAFIVNVARAGVLDEEALLVAPREGRLGGAALDVRADESRATPLAGLPNVVLTPHLGSMTIEAQRWIGQVLVESIDAGLRGEPVSNRIC